MSGAGGMHVREINTRNMERNRVGLSWKLSKLEISAAVSRC